MANAFVNKKVDLTSTSATTLYTVPSATTAIIKSILVSDDSGSGDTITITITDTSDNVFSVFRKNQRNFTLVDSIYLFFGIQNTKMAMKI